MPLPARHRIVIRRLLDGGQSVPGQVLEELAKPLAAMLTVGRVIHSGFGGRAYPDPARRVRREAESRGRGTGSHGLPALSQRRVVPQTLPSSMIASFQIRNSSAGMSREAVRLNGPPKRRRDMWDPHFPRTIESVSSCRYLRAADENSHGFVTLDLN